MIGPDVALIAPYPALDDSHHAGSSGVASYSANLARALRASGARVHVAAPGSAGPRRSEDDGDGLRIDRLPAAGARGLRDAVATVRSSGAAVAHLQFELFLYGGPSALLAALGSINALRRGGVPTVVTLHQTVDPAAVDRSYTALHRVSVPAPVARVGIRTLQRSIRRRADATVVHEEPFRRVVSGAEVIPHGIEVTERIDRSDARRRLGVDDDRFLALCFGFLAPYKGLETALDAGELAGPDVEVVVAGGEHPRLAESGDDYAQRLRRRYATTARFTGWVPGDDVVAWFSAADVALFPYPEPFSSSGALALALACGTPILLSSPLGRCIGAPSQLLAPTTRDLAGRLRRLADDPDERAHLGEWTSCLADGRSWPDVAEAHRDLYERVAA